MGLFSLYDVGFLFWLKPMYNSRDGGLCCFYRCWSWRRTDFLPSIITIIKKLMEKPHAYRACLCETCGMKKNRCYKCNKDIVGEKLQAYLCHCCVGKSLKCTKCKKQIAHQQSTSANLCGSCVFFQSTCMRCNR